jgi:hypothetical protein
MWTSSQKGGSQYVISATGTAITSDETLWAEYTNFGESTCTLTLEVIDTTSGNELFTEELIYRPFNSVTIAFVGENQQAGDPSYSPGVNDWVIQELLNGYDVHVYDDGYDLSTTGDCNKYGEGVAFDEIYNAINNRGVTNVAILGYSHGGGSVYNLAWRMYYDGGTTGNPAYMFPPQKIQNPYNIVFTSYIDAVTNSNSINFYSEERRPLNSGFHLNQYQTNGWTYQSSYVSGCPTIGGTSSNTINIAYTDLLHDTIDEDLRVHSQLTTYFESIVTR